MRQIPVRALLTALLSGLVLIASVTTSSAQGVRVIVELRLPSRHVPEGDLPDAARVTSQRQAIAARAALVLSKLPARARRAPQQFQTVPFVVLEVTPEERAALALDPDVERVLDDVLLFPVLTDSAPLVEADQAWNAGYDGSGTVIAVLDNGVDKTHPFLVGKVVEEACYSKTEPGATETLCPNGLDQQIGPGAAAPCTLASCAHGTHVAGIAAGSDPSAAQPIAGVARGANLFAIQVFTKVIDPAKCGGAAPCTGAFSSDVIAALERVYTVALGGAHTIASVNMSLGGQQFTSACDSEPFFGLNGVSLASSEAVEIDIEQPNPLGGAALPARFSVRMDSVTADTASLKTVTTYDGASLVRLTESLARQAGAPIAPEELAKLPPIEMADEGTYLFDRKVGLMREVVVSRRVTVGPNRRLDAWQIRLLSGPR